MKIAHEIIKDLIPLYVDGNLSDASKETVEDHLKNCPECRKYLQEIQNSDNDLDPNVFKVNFEADAETLKMAKRTMKKKRIKTIMISVITTGAAVFVIGWLLIENVAALNQSIFENSTYTVSINDNHVPGQKLENSRAVHWYLNMK